MRTPPLSFLQLKFPCETREALPTIGFNVESIKIAPGLEITVWDSNGNEFIRPLWRYNFKNADGIIWVVDAQDRERFQQSSQEFQKVISDDLLPRGDLPILIFANKQDLPGAAAAEEISEKLGLLNFSRENWHVQASDAKSGDGLIEGMNIFGKMVEEFVKNSRQ